MKGIRCLATRFKRLDVGKFIANLSLLAVVSEQFQDVISEVHVGSIQNLHVEDSYG